jgi:gamma-glutamylaminecyclotransferase
MSTRLFVYGTLKRGCSNHRHLAGQTFLGLARTPPGFRLYDLGGYPSLVAQSDDDMGVIGEVWLVDDNTLEELDRFEGVHEGLYRREPLPLLAPFANEKIDAYVSTLPVSGRVDVGSEWIERGRDIPS